MLHELKTWPVYYRKVKQYQKRFEYRTNDRNFQVGDTLYLREYNDKTKEYSGKSLKVNILYVLRINTDAILSISEPYDIKESE